MKILITGFTAFGSVWQNPSQVVIERLRDHASRFSDSNVTYEILDVTYAEAGGRVEELVVQLEPDLTVLLGATAERRPISLERFALNMDDAGCADNAGIIRRATPIVGGGRAAYQTSLPIDRVCQQLHSPASPMQVSNHAGTFVCNHVYYRALHQLSLLGLPATAVFVHLPLPKEVVSPRDSAAYNWESLYSTVDECIKQLAAAV